MEVLIDILLLSGWISYIYIGTGQLFMKIRTVYHNELLIAIQIITIGKGRIRRQTYPSSIGESGKTDCHKAQVM